MLLFKQCFAGIQTTGTQAYFVLFQFIVPQLKLKGYSNSEDSKVTSLTED